MSDDRQLAANAPEESTALAEPPPRPTRRHRRHASGERHVASDRHVTHREAKARRKRRNRMILKGLMAAGIVVASLYLAFHFGEPHIPEYVPPP